MNKFPNFILDDCDFEWVLDKYSLSEDELIEYMVLNGWTKGNETDIRSPNYMENIYYPPEIDNETEI